MRDTRGDLHSEIVRQKRRAARAEERLSRLVAAVRRVVDGSAWDCTGGGWKHRKLPTSTGPLTMSRPVDCAGAELSREQWCSACTLVAELEACEVDRG